jgi:4-carboxymuconolactone decarboxylase
LRAISPDFADIITDFAFGEIYARPGLDMRTRQIVTVAALTALNNAPAQLEAHIQGALNLGVTREEIFEIVIQMALYGGFAAASNGLLAADAVFNAQAKKPLKR